MDSKRLKLCFTILKWVFFMCLFGICLKTILETLWVLISGKTTVVSDVVMPEKGMNFPHVTICNQTGYKNTDINLNLKDYLDSTMTLESFFVDIEPEDGPKLNYSIKTTFAKYKGGHSKTLWTAIVYLDGKK